jgi:hypothetical protein
MYYVLWEMGNEESGIRDEESGFRIQDSGFRNEKWVPITHHP